MRVSLEIKPVMLPFFTSFEVDKQKRTLKPYMAPVNHNIINETTWLKIVHTLMGNFCQDSDDTKGLVAMEDMGNDACVLVGCHQHVSNCLKNKLVERWSNFYLRHYENSLINQADENLIPLIRLNPVRAGDESVKRGLFSIMTNTDELITSVEFKDILKTDATTEEGEQEVLMYFQVDNGRWKELLQEWQEKHKTPLTGFRRYYELLYLVKSQSRYDHIWFSFFEGMHRHAAIVAGLVCSKFNHSTNELDPGSLTLDDFKNEGVLKSFKDPEITVAAHLDMIMTKTIDAPMFHNGFNLTAYIPKTQGQGMNAINKDAGKLIEAARMYSEWISNFKLASATRTLSKNIAQWLETTLNHSTKDTRNNRNYRPKVNEDKASVIVPQNDTKPTNFQKDMKKKYQHDDAVCYGCPSCITSGVWDAYIKNPFDPVARKEWVRSIALPCTDENKVTEMTPPYGITYESVTTDIGTLANRNGPRKVDARMYNGYLIIPGLVYHLLSKMKNVSVNTLLGNEFEVKVINFIARYGNYTRKTPHVTIHGAYSRYIEMTDPTYVNACTGDSQVIPVTLFLVVLYNACFMFQEDNDTNLLIMALDTFDLGADVGQEKFITTFSESKFPNYSIQENFAIQHLLTNHYFCLFHP